MLRLIKYLISTGIQTVAEPCPAPDAEWRGMPALTDNPCGSGCNACVDVCPTNAISTFSEIGKTDVALDLGACIQCGLCIDMCPTGTIVENKTFQVASISREDLVLTTSQTRAEKVAEILERVAPSRKSPAADGELDTGKNLFSESLYARVVSTGCSACDAEIGATANPIFDLERFGVHIVASPRFADALFVTGPVGKAMQDPLVRCYGAMAQPRLVVAVGTCAISGGMHRDGYAEANGVDSVLPVNIYIPGCPPHPWSIIHGAQVAMGKMEPFKPQVQESKGE